MSKCFGPNSLVLKTWFWCCWEWLALLSWALPSWHWHRGVVPASGILYQMYTCGLAIARHQHAGTHWASGGYSGIFNKAGTQGALDSAGCMLYWPQDAELIEKRFVTCITGCPGGFWAAGETDAMVLVAFLILLIITAVWLPGYQWDRLSGVAPFSMSRRTSQLGLSVETIYRSSSLRMD